MTKNKLTFKITILLLCLLFTSLHTVYAQFPEKGDQLVIDSTGKLEKAEVKRLHEYIDSLSNSYTVVFLDKLEKDGTEYTTELFAHYSLGTADTLLVIDVTEAELYYAYGNEMTRKGLTDEIIDAKKNSIFSSYAKKGETLIAVTNFIRTVELELENIAAKRERESGIVVGGQEGEGNEEKEEESSSTWGKVTMYSIVLLLLAFAGSFLVRRNLKKKVDELEASKIQLENRPFTAELSRVKGLKMAGETEARFEKWRGEWEEIVTVTLPDIEETLVDIDEYADSYRFFKAKGLIKETKTRLEGIEHSLDRIIQEIDELTSSEKNNRFKVEELHEELQKIKSLLQKNSLLLGVSYPLWYEKFKKATGWFDSFNEAQEGGDYLSANDILQAIEEVFQQIKEAIEVIPELVKEVENRIPQQIKEVEYAVAEMKEKGYVLEHTTVHERITALQKKREVVQYLENGQIKETQDWIAQTLQEIEDLFHLLEEEVESKAFVLQYFQSLEPLLNEITTRIEQLTLDIENTKHSYTWESEWEEKFTQIKAVYEELKTAYDELQVHQENLQQTYPQVKPILTAFQEKVEKFDGSAIEIAEILSTLKEDEVKAGETAGQIKQTIVKVKVNLRKSNLPGVPEHLQTGLEISEEALQELYTELRKVPIDMTRVQYQLRELKAQVESISQVTKTIIHQAERAELYIQYANRYRRMNPTIAETIDAAESAFRTYQYKDALELAEDALEMADKKWKDKYDVEEESVS
ncbi:septation ring formation regulator EzrA [Caldalkalibacillus mannanilyticus]|uniref:septation ring formation regulator EzrA n=1 Tax=Caldalkalibacillus mannanilyticus TaxID=1418 RepID=UPI000469E9FF|nr:septation ring formation regulator EzrA [Caldalkalibacillus mannanilyticus]